MKKELSLATQIFVGAMAIVVAAAVVGVWTAAFNIRDSVRDTHADVGSMKASMIGMQMDIGFIKTNYPSREEMNHKLESLQSETAIWAHGASKIENKSQN